MFGKMRRFKQALSEEECIKVLKEAPRGVLSVITEAGYPYALPIDHWYDEKTNTVCFHGAKAGHKIDCIEKCDKVSFTCYDEGFRKEGEWALNISSVIAFGRIKKVTDYDRTVEICSGICRKFTDDEEYLAKEIKESVPNVLCLEIEIEHMTGKLVNES